MDDYLMIDNTCFILYVFLVVELNIFSWSNMLLACLKYLINPQQLSIDLMSKDLLFFNFKPVIVLIFVLPLEYVWVL